jgi:hypothetical protein
LASPGPIAEISVVVERLLLGGIVWDNLGRPEGLASSLPHPVKANARAMAAPMIVRFMTSSLWLCIAVSDHQGARYAGGT